MIIDLEGMKASTELDKEEGLEFLCMYVHFYLLHVLVLVVWKNVITNNVLGK